MKNLKRKINTDRFNKIYPTILITILAMYSVAMLWILVFEFFQTPIVTTYYCNPDTYIDDNGAMHYVCDSENMIEVREPQNN